MIRLEQDYVSLTLTEAERALIGQHSDRTRHHGYALSMKAKIMKTAGDFSLWLQRNQEWSHRDEEAFFTRFGYMPSPDEEAKIVYGGVRDLLDTLERYSIQLQRNQGAKRA